MGGFASALVVSMFRQALADQGLQQPSAPIVGGRTVTLAEKKVLLGSVLETAGPLPLLRVADAVPAFGHHPVARIFAGARSGADVLERWLRIERYFHSRHRSHLIEAGANDLLMEHIDSLGEQPTPGEDLVVAGLVLGLLRWAGGRHVRLSLVARDSRHDDGQAGRWLAFDGADYREPPKAGYPTGRWHLTWSDFAPRADAGTQLDMARRRIVDGRLLDQPLAAALFAEIAADPGARPSLTACARARGMSARTLQRRLHEAGWSLRSIAAAARLDVAARLLADTETPIGVVGLLAGYSDQPHFQREFVKGLGPTPAAYRRMAASTSTG